MPLMRILKENHVLIAGILLPLLLVGLLTLAKSFPFHVVPDPTFRAVYAVNPYIAYGNFVYKVTDEGKLGITFVSPKANRQTGNIPTGNVKGRIYVFTPATGALEDTSLPVPTLKEDEEKLSIPFEKFSSLKLSGQVTAPDGYRYEDRGYSHSSFLTDVLSFHSRSHGPLQIVVKDSRVIPLPKPTDFYGETVFIGWVVEEIK
ncbi:MAG: hypothetical protein JNN09_07570 [Alphaproteobacteria bacterium]|nr:hypothetical protein [Alphaproteobacteria bacterium]